MEDGAVFIGQGALVWFLVMIVRAWAPAQAREVIDGPARVWGLVLVVSAVIVMLQAGGWSEIEDDLATAALDAIALALTAVGIDNVQAAVPQAASELNLNVGRRDAEDAEDA